MNPPPDVYDADGHPYEDRRKAIRREDDLDPAASRGYEFWAKLMFLHKGKFLAFASALVGTGDRVASWLGGAGGRTKGTASPVPPYSEVFLALFDVPRSSTSVG